MRNLARFGLVILSVVLGLVFLFELIRFFAELNVSPLHYVIEDAVILLASAAGIAGCLLKLRRMRATQDAQSPLPVPAGPLVVPVQKVGIAIFVAAGGLFVWLGLMAFLLSWHFQYPLALSLLTTLMLCALTFRKIFSADYYLRIDQAGLHHYRVGTIPWSDVSGIRINSFTTRGFTKYFFVVMVNRPDRYADRLRAWFQVFHRMTLRRQHALTFPLQMARGKPAHIFEAAVRFRSAVSPPALTGWEGSRKDLLPLMKWMQEHPLTVGMDQERALMGQRIASTMAASYGGWNRLDNLETVKLRAEMSALSQTKIALIHARIDQSIANSEPGRMHGGRDAAARDAEREFTESADGRRLATLQSQLQTQVASAQRRQLWQVVIVVIVMVIFYVGMMLLKHGAAH
jgi:hypothetical protein